MPPRKYPWERWRNGKEYTLHDWELDVTLQQFITQLHAHARNNSDDLVAYRVKTKTDSSKGTITFYFWRVGL